MNKRKQKVYYSDLKAILGSIGLNRYQKQTLLDKIIPVIRENVQDIMCAYAHQEMLDVVAIVLNDLEGIGATRWKRIENAVYETLKELEDTSGKVVRDGGNGNQSTAIHGTATGRLQETYEASAED